MAKVSSNTVADDNGTKSSTVTATAKRSSPDNPETVVNETASTSPSQQQDMTTTTTTTRTKKAKLDTTTTSLTSAATGSAMSAATLPSKKVKKKSSTASSTNDSTASSTTNGNNSKKPNKVTLTDIKDRMQELLHRIPIIPDNDFKKVSDNDNDTTNDDIPHLSCPYDKSQLYQFASQLHAVLQDLNLLLACTNPATYVWVSDRSGASDQNLAVLGNELLTSQEQLMARVTPRLNDVLAPVRTLITDKTITTKTKGPLSKETRTKMTLSNTNTATSVGNNDDDDDDTTMVESVEIKHNLFRTTYEDPEYVNLCFVTLGRNAPMLRQVVVAHVSKMVTVITDYLTAQESQPSNGRNSFVY